MWAPDIYEGSPIPVTTFLSIAPKITISTNVSCLSIYGSYGATLQQIFFFCSIASMILGALTAIAHMKVKHPTHNWRIFRFNSYWMHTNGTLQ
ncbi:putative NADH:ubiquinone reductase (H(+)-translocating) [Helianthus anomalus]